MGTRLWLWPNLLSLDAPLVALLWQVLFVRCFHAELGLIPAVLLGLAVWLVYSADRMLDAWRGSDQRPRHTFYRRNWRTVLPVWSIAFLLTGWLAWTFLPVALLTRGAVLTAGTGLYFGAVHGWPRLRDRSKEAAVAIFFALGVSVVAWPQVRSAADVLAIVLFGALCWMNCAAIEDWENGRVLRPAVVIASALAAMIAAVLLQGPRPVLACAETAAVLGLMLLDRLRVRISPDALRVLADVALLTPLLVLHTAGLRP